MEETTDIAGMMLVETGTYQDQYFRPFNTDVRADAVHRLEQNTQEGRTINAATVGPVASEFIRPSSTVEGHVSIPGGWGDRRFRFMLKVNVGNPFGLGMTQRIYFGHTDRCNASLNFLDPDMRVYFNNEIQVSMGHRPTPQGPVPQAHVVSSTQIITPYDMDTADATRNPFAVQGHMHADVYLIRPEDVYSVGGNRKIADSLQFENHGQIDQIIDQRTFAGRGHIEHAKRQHTSPTRYLTDTLGGYQRSLLEMGETETHFNDEIALSNAYTNVKSPTPHSNPFFERLVGSTGFAQNGFVTWRELTEVFPEIDSRTQFSMHNDRTIRQVSQAEDSEYWKGSNYIHVAASLLAQVVPGLMMDNLLTNISFSATNGQGDNEFFVDFHPQNVRSFVDGIDLRDPLSRFQLLLIQDVLSGITYRNQIPFQLSMMSDLKGETIIDISLNNDPLVRFIAPTFCDSLYTPLRTMNQNLQNQISHDLTYLAQHTIDYSRYQNPGLLMQSGETFPDLPGSHLRPDPQSEFTTHRQETYHANEGPGTDDLL